MVGFDDHIIDELAEFLLRIVQSMVIAGIGVTQRFCSHVRVAVSRCPRGAMDNALPPTGNLPYAAVCFVVATLGVYTVGRDRADQPATTAISLPS